MKQPDWDKIDKDISEWLGHKAMPSRNPFDATSMMLRARLSGWWFEVSSRGGSNGTWQAVCDHKSDPDETRCYSEFSGIKHLTFAQAISLAFHGSLTAYQAGGKK